MSHNECQTRLLWKTTMYCRETRWDFPMPRNNTRNTCIKSVSDKFGWDLLLGGKTSRVSSSALDGCMGGRVGTFPDICAAQEILTRLTIPALEEQLWKSLQYRLSKNSGHSENIQFGLVLIIRRVFGSWPSWFAAPPACTEAREKWDVGAWLLEGDANKHKASTSTNTSRFYKVRIILIRRVSNATDPVF